MILKAYTNHHPDYITALSLSLSLFLSITLHCICRCVGHGKRLLTLLEIDLFKNAAFLSLLAVIFAYVYGFQGWIIYLVPNAVDKGLTPYRATALATAGAGGQFIGLTGTGVLIDTGVLTADMVSIITTIITY